VHLSTVLGLACVVCGCVDAADQPSATRESASQQSISQLSMSLHSNQTERQFAATPSAAASDVARGIALRPVASQTARVASAAALLADGGVDPGRAGGSDAAGDAAAGASSAGPADAGGLARCTRNLGSSTDADVNIDLAVEFQAISGFGGINVPGWIPDLTPDQVDTAFGNGPGQIGMSILRVRVPFDPSAFALEVPSAARAVALGAKVIASPWTPPPSLKTNQDSVGGELEPDAYEAYADHLLSFRDFMQSNGVPLYAVSVQNEPDVRVDYESCDWTATQIHDWLIGQGPRFGDTKLIAAESFNFNRAMTDPILNDPAAAAEVDIVGGHIYGNGLFDYPLARQRGKEVWMTEHYTDSNNDANAWPLALAVGREINDSMTANFSAYIWWYIRRRYGPLTEDGLVSKRGYMIAQYAKFVRPGAIRIGATQPPDTSIRVTAYKNSADRVVVVAVNSSPDPRAFDIDVFNGCVDAFSRFTTSATKSLADDGSVATTDGRASVTLDGESVTTFVSQIATP
jgi:glucuronoarabinoxylan endo-1,4-beta-xylanase